MSNVEKFLVVSAKADFVGGNAPYCIHDFPGDAVEAAKRSTESSRLEMQIWRMTLIGTTDIPPVQFNDLRPQAVEKHR